MPASFFFFFFVHFSLTCHLKTKQNIKKRKKKKNKELASVKASLPHTGPYCKTYGRQSAGNIIHILARMDDFMVISRVLGYKVVIKLYTTLSNIPTRKTNLCKATYLERNQRPRHMRMDVNEDKRDTKIEKNKNRKNIICEEKIRGKQRIDT